MKRDAPPSYLAFMLMLSGEDAAELHELLEAVASGETPTASGRALLWRVAGQVREALDEANVSGAESGSAAGDGFGLDFAPVTAPGGDA